MNENGKRIYHNQFGKVISIKEESSGGVALHKDEIITYIDLPYGSKALENVLEYHIENGEIVVDLMYEPQLTPEEKIKELEDQLLLMEDEKLGGIL